jgi:hypothetical protein
MPVAGLTAAARLESAAYCLANGIWWWYCFGIELRYRAGTVPLSIDLSISCRRVIFFAAFFLRGFADVVVVAAGSVAAGAVAAGAAPVFGAVCASPTPAGKAANAIVAAIKETVGMKEILGMKTSNAVQGRNAISVSPWHWAMQAAFSGVFAARCQLDAISQAAITSPCPTC